MYVWMCVYIICMDVCIYNMYGCIYMQFVPNVKTTSIPHFTSRMPGFKHPLFVPFVEKNRGNLSAAWLAW